MIKMTPSLFLFSKLFNGSLSEFSNSGRFQHMRLLKRKLATRVRNAQLVLCKWLPKACFRKRTISMLKEVFASHSDGGRHCRSVNCSPHVGFDLFLWHGGIVVLSIVYLGQYVIDEALYVKIGLFLFRPFGAAPSHKMGGFGSASLTDVCRS